MKTKYMLIAPLLIVVFVSLYYLSTINYLLFHSFIELLAAVLAITIFSIGWNTRKYAQNRSMLILATGYLLVGILTVFHLLSYRGIGVFPNHGANLPTQFWISTRYVESITILIAVIYLKKQKNINDRALLAASLFGGTAIVLTILGGFFPACFIDGAGLTPFKVVSEYIICGILLLSVYIFWKAKDNLKRNLLVLILSAISTTILSELSFTLYKDPNGFFNFLGHFFMFFSILLLYIAFVQGSLARPYEFLFNYIASYNDKLIEKNEEIKKQHMEIMTLTNNVPDIICRYDRNLRFTYVNSKAEQERGILREHFLGKTMGELGMPQSVVEVLEKALHFAFSSKSEQAVETSYDTAVGRKHYHSVIAPEIAEDGEVSTVVSITRDISELKELQLALNLEKQNLHITLESIGDGVIATDNQGEIKLLNRVAEQLTGWRREEGYGRPFEEVFYIVNEFTRGRCRNPISEVLQSGNIIELSSDTVLISKDGIERPIEYSAAPIMDTEHEVNGVVLVFRDFTEKKQEQERIKYLSFNDQLTGLYNRRFFEQELKRLDSKRNLPLTLVMADVNGLKLTNDAFGHLLGDQLLQKAAEIIKSECRVDDIIARIGGDEFVILLPKTEPQQAESIVRRIKHRMASEKVNSIIVSLSFGWDTKQSLTQDINAVLKRAEENMYKSKLSESSSMRNRTIQVILNTLYEKSEIEKQHSIRVSELCEALGMALNLRAEHISELRTAGLLHDIGKISIDEQILHKDGVLNHGYSEIKRHPETGYRILSSVNEFAHIAEYVLAHHERWDGKGYPKGLKGQEIPLQARIIAIANAYDVMSRDSHYREALSKEAAIGEIRRKAGTQFDPDITKVFIEKIAVSDSWKERN